MGQPGAVMAQLLREQMWFHKWERMSQSAMMEGTLDHPGPCCAAQPSVWLELIPKVQRALNFDLCTQACQVKDLSDLWSCGQVNINSGLLKLAAKSVVDGARSIQGAVCIFLQPLSP